VKFFGGERYQDVKRIMRTLDLHTVCESARCPTWRMLGNGTATFMILGDICTRACGSVPCLRGSRSDRRMKKNHFAWRRPWQRWAAYAVVTSVNAMTSPTRGAHFARTIEEIRRRVPGCKVEVLIPDFA